MGIRHIKYLLQTWEQSSVTKVKHDPSKLNYNLEVIFEPKNEFGANLKVIWGNKVSLHPV